MKKYLALLILLTSVSSFAASKCLNEIKTTCPDHSKRDQCLRENLEKFSAPCVQTAKDILGTEDKTAGATETAVAHSGANGIAPAAVPPVAKIAPPNDSAVGPCAEDFHKFCVAQKNDVKAVRDCMGTHWKELKPECQKESQVAWGLNGTSFEPAKEVPANQNPPPAPPAPPPSQPPVGARMDSGAMENCEKEVQALCPMKKEEGQGKCMEESISKLSPECKTMFQNLASASQTPNKAKLACAEDVKKLCPDSVGNQQKLECLHANLDKVSPDCKANGKMVLE